MALTPKQEAFAQAYLRLGDASAAYREAYSTDRWTPKSVNEQASKMLRHPKIFPRVSEIRAELEKRNEITLDWIVEGLRRNAARAMQETAVLDSKGNPTGGYRYEGAVANKAYELLAKLLALGAGERHEVSGPRGGPITLDVGPKPEFDHDGYARLFGQHLVQGQPGIAGENGAEEPVDTTNADAEAGALPGGSPS